MGIICKDANIYDKDGKLIEKAPIQNKWPGFQPPSRKYPGSSNIKRNLFG